MDESLVGRTGSPFRMVVEEGKVHEFARATRSEDPDHLVEGHPVSPGTFLAVSAFWQGPGSSPYTGVTLNFERILHGEQEFVFPDGPPVAGTELTGRSRIDRVYTKEGRRGGTMTFTEVVTEFTDADGRVVAESRGTSIETSQPAGAG
ncbi:MAG TPA: MaoC family dehydratase N-terminal domain-containing protein [Acidimicrobiales bacterium]|nr:MaoC family dehydratase N-terminal domain-containing protein [Acidimicrobiales bacterium]